MLIQIQSGAFDIEKPEIRLSDIIHNLGTINRYTGSSDYSWSVAQHTILCEAISSGFKLPSSARLALLLHDAPEAYIQDQNGVWKSLLGDWYKKIERRLEEAIAKKFGFDAELFGNPIVGQIDRAALYIESMCLFKNRVPELWTTLDQQFGSAEICHEWIGILRSCNGVFAHVDSVRETLKNLILTELAK